MAQNKPEPFKKNREQQIPELLAPVGGRAQLKAAVQNGADAVYMGGPLFNARIKAENFTEEDMRWAIDYAHERDTKLYITLNTLIRDDELKRAFSYVNFLYGAGADAVILQDLGIARLIHNYLPEFPMHLSTQGTIYNPQAVPLVKRLGFSRIVSARELSLQEIEAMAAACHAGETDCDLEVFVHGALCMCYSGQCQMSRMLGGINGRSGNRGLCAQPCRLPYHTETGQPEYLLSPKDLCGLEQIPQLARAGVDSLKIEGRLKSPQYVAVVTSIYRKYLDLYADSGAIAVEKEDLQALQQIFSRGGFTSGYLLGNPGDKLLSGKSPKNTGRYLGKVQSVKKGSTLVDVKAVREISLGDGVEVHGKAVTGNVISYLKPLKHGVLRIGDLKGSVAPGDVVYQVTSKTQQEQAVRSYTSGEQRKRRVGMEFCAAAGKAPSLFVREMPMLHQRRGREWDDAHCLQIEVTGTQIIEMARNKPMTEDRIRTQLQKLGDTPFAAEQIKCTIEDGLMIPVAVLNGLRREAMEQLLQEKRLSAKAQRRPLQEADLERIVRDEHLEPEHCSLQLALRTVGRKPQCYCYTRETILQIAAEDHALQGVLAIPLEYFLESELQETLREKMPAVQLIPYVLNVSKGNLDRYLSENFERIAAAVRSSGILLGNLGWIEAFQSAGVPVYGDYGLNVYNAQSVKLFEELGVPIWNPSQEAELFFCGDIPLMITEHPIDCAKIYDRKSTSYTILQWISGDKYLIFAEHREHAHEIGALENQLKQQKTVYMK